ncbi:MAG: hypothetical protein ACRETN_01335 [Nevskiales bacterium]
MLRGHCPAHRLITLVAVAALAACQSAPPPVREAQPEPEPPEQLEQVFDAQGEGIPESISPKTIELAREVELESEPAPADERYEPLSDERTNQAPPPAVLDPDDTGRSHLIPGPSEEVYLLPMAKPRPGAPADKSQPLAVAEAVQLDINPRSGGTWINEGPAVTWRLTLKSVGASSLSFYFNPVRLPPGSELLIGSPDGSTRHGPYTAADLQGRKEFWTPGVPGEVAVVSLKLPPQAAQSGLQLNLAQARIGYQGQ